MAIKTLGMCFVVSSVEAEYIAVVDTFKKVFWVKNFLQELVKQYKLKYILP
jgi:hypothetical protein